MDYDRSSHSKYLILYHIILVTKYRHKILNLFDIKSIFRNVEKESHFEIFCLTNYSKIKEKFDYSSLEIL